MSERRGEWVRKRRLKREGKSHVCMYAYSRVVVEAWLLASLSLQTFIESTMYIQVVSYGFFFFSSAVLLLSKIGNTQKQFRELDSVTFKLPLSFLANLFSWQGATIANTTVRACYICPKWNHENKIVVPRQTAMSTFDYLPAISHHCDAFST